MNENFLDSPGGSGDYQTPVAVMEPARWLNGPPICNASNLPSFSTWQAAIAFSEQHALLSIQLKWRCRHCEGWHFWCNASAPAGQTSGTVRESPVPKRIVEMAERDGVK